MALAEEDEWSFEDEDEYESNEFSDGNNHHAGIPWDFDEDESDEDDENVEEDDDEDEDDDDEDDDDENDDESDEEEEDDGGQLVSGGRFGSHHGIAESMGLPVEILGKPVVIADKSGEEFCVFDHEICSAEITLRNLVNCTVNLCGVSSAVLIEDLQNCVVFVGPCSGCVIISRCNACTINVVCKKLEVEKSTNCTLYVKTISQTFIKASSAITFAPLKRGYEEMQDQVEVIGLEGTLNCWDCVVDVSIEQRAESPSYRLLYKDPTENGSDSEDTDSSQAHFNVQKCKELAPPCLCSLLLAQAGKAGINPFVWFSNHDRARQETVKLATFELAFQGLLVALCASTPGRYDELVSTAVAQGFVRDATIEHCRNGRVLYKDFLNNYGYTPPSSRGKKRRKRKSYSVKKLLEEHIELHGTDKVVREINFWKWSLDGRYPCGKGQDTETIAVLSLRRALQAIELPEFSQTEMLKFSKFMAEEVETDAEKRIRNGSSKDQDLPEFVHIKALLRWMNAIRLQNSMTHEHWTARKVNGEAKQRADGEKKLRLALAGNIEALESLLVADKNRTAVKHVLGSLDFAEFLPDWAVESEAEAAVDAWMNNAGISTAFTRARSAQLDELYQSRLAVAKDAMKNSVAAKLDLIERYYKDKKSGSASGSFELFLRTRESYAERKKEALQNWEKEKQKEDALKASDSSAFAVIDVVMKHMEELVSMTSHEQRLTPSGLTTCRSTRYLGLDLEACFAHLRKMQANGKVLLSKEEFHKIFDGLLIQLVADPRTAKDAWALLRPVATSEEELHKIVNKEEHEKARKEQRDELQKDGAIDETKVKKLALGLIQKRLEDDIYAKVGFVSISGEAEKQEIIEAWQEHVEEQQQKAVKAWAKTKRKEERRRKKEKRVQTQQAQARREEQHEQRLERIDHLKRETKLRTERLNQKKRCRQSRPDWVDIVEPKEPEKNNG